MAGSRRQRGHLRFGDYDVDLASGELCRGGQRIRLRDKSFQVLALLLERAGQVVTRDELSRRLWPNGVFVDFDNNLNAAVARLRYALDDSADQPRFIETLPKHGYRFIGRVFDRPDRSERPTARPRLLVLPFVNLSGDPAQEYFSDAMTDEIITELVHLTRDRLAVMARTTAMHYKGTAMDLARIASELGVDYLVEGSVRRPDDRLGINVQLIRADDQTHLWAQRYEAGLQDVFSLQRCIAQAIAAHLGLPSSSGTIGARDQGELPDRRHATSDLVAYNEYLRGRHQLAGLGPETLAQAKRHFEAAIARDPDFALAHDSLAETCWWLGYLGFMRPLDAFSTGVLHAVRALEIDNTLAETHALLAQYHKQLHYDWPEVERGMALALALDPNSPLVRIRYAWNLLMPYGRFEEAVAEFEQALDVDPLSTYARTGLAITLLLWGRYDRGIEEARRTLALDPNAAFAYLAIGAACLYQGRVAEAIAAHRKAVEVSGEAAALLAWLGLTLGISGQREEAREVLARLHAMARDGFVPPTSFAWVHIGLGDADAAFEWLDRAVDERDQYMMPIKSYGFLAPLRADPRYGALLRKMNLAD